VRFFPVPTTESVSEQSGLDALAWSYADVSGIVSLELGAANAEDSMLRSDARNRIAETDFLVFELEVLLLIYNPHRDLTTFN
jgi:hypothetical protein